MTIDEFVEACDALQHPTVPEVLPLAEAYYLFPHCSLGGAVHIVLEDPNWEDSSADWCVENADNWGESWGEPGPYHAAFARLIRRCSYTQRKKLCHRHAYPDPGIPAR